MTKLPIPLLILVAAQAFGQAATTNGPIAMPFVNEATTGTTLNGTAVINSSGQAIGANTSQTTVPTFIVVGNAGISGNALLATAGLAYCRFDASTSSTGGQFVVNSTTTGKDCKVLSSVTAGTWVIGSLYDSGTTSGQLARVLVTSYFYGGSASPQVYPGAGVANSNGTSWLTSYQVGAAANNLVQLNASGQLPAVSAALLTNFPILNQPTTGQAGTALALAALPSNCGANIAAIGILANGNATGCFTPSFATLASGTNNNALTMGSGGVFDYTGTAEIDSNWLLKSVLPSLSVGYLQWTGSAWAFGSPAGSGTVTSAGLNINGGSSSGIFTVAGTNPITGTGTFNLQTAGTSGGLLYMSSSTVPSSSGALTGIVRGGNPPTASEMSQDVTTSGSNVATVVGLKANILPSLVNGYLQWTGSAWAFGTPSGSGTVTTFSAGNLSPIFTSSVVNPASAPALSFSLSNAGANTVFGNCTGSTAAPSYCSLVAGMLPTIFQTNSVNNTTGNTLNMSPSTVNAVGLTVTPTNTGTNVETYEVTGGSYTGNAATATSASGLKFGSTVQANSSTAPTTGQFLEYNGTNIVGGTPSGTISGLTTHQGVVAASGTTVATSPTYYASTYTPAPGGDYCALLNGIWTTMTPGSTVYWDIGGPLKCASNPWHGIYSSGDITVSGSTATVVRGEPPDSTWTGTMNLCAGTSCGNYTISSCTSSACTMTTSITGSPTTYGYNLTTIPGTLIFVTPGTMWTSAPWVKPPKTHMIGMGEANSSGNGTQAFLLVGCPGTSTYCAAKFPIDVPVLAEVSNIQDFNYTGAGTTTRTDWMTISCAYVQGVRGYMNWYTQENGGASWPTVRNCGNNGIVMDIGGSSTASGDGDNSSYDHLNLGDNTAETGATAACTFGSVILRVGNKSGGPGPKEIGNVTANAIACQGLSPQINLNHAVEFGGTSAVHVVGKTHTEETSLSAIQFGTYTLLGSVNTSGTTATWLSGDLLPFSGGCGSATTVIVSDVYYTLATCSTTGFTTTATMGTQSTAPFSIDTHLGASNIRVDVADHCCSANFTGTASGTTFTVSAGAVPQSNWTGNVLLGSNSYTIASTTSTTIVTTATITGSPTSGTYGSIYGIDSASQSKAISIGPFKALSPNKPSMMMADGFNTTIPAFTDSSMTCYEIDQNDNVLCDDSGVNKPNFIGGALMQGGFPATVTIFQGPVVLPTSAIASGGKAAWTAVTATGANPASPQYDKVSCGFPGDPSGVTGYGSSSSGGLQIVPYLTANTINGWTYNNTLSSITPGAVTLNCQVTR